eukprot:gnl/Dysnectes_brevis/9662_a18216_155.p1 GENE.gnl/Dysnectes_brevis/9662_a18216_155~~gnl/Dysnectes_brevis/9662_a18216_155.p1  ORF type:complete len:150 (+),score=37.54 gnl/Dysnectes_brevis/9662_a18216_155:84-533(+)
MSSKMSSHIPKVLNCTSEVVSPAHIDFSSVSGCTVNWTRPKGSTIALTTFKKKPYLYTCCQAIIATYKGVHSPEIAATAKFAGGRAPGNYCGAIYGALLVAPDMEDTLKARFAEGAGSLKCKEIKAIGELACPGCVRLACDILDDVCFE